MLGRRLQRAHSSSLAVTPDDGLFFKVPSNIRSYDKKVFGHYFGPYPLSLDNADPTNDSYKRAYLNPTGSSGNYAAYGGLLRDRPLPTQPKTDYVKQNARQEIAWAVAAGIDGMWCDLLGLSGNNWDRYIALRDAAIAYYPGFYVLPMIDTNGAHGTATASQIANSIAQFANRSSSYYMPDGTYLVGSFKAEGKDVAWWQAVFDACKNEQGINTSFAAVFLNYNSSSSGYTSITDIGSNWGNGSDPSVISASTGGAPTARSRGQKWMAGLQSQNVRPNQSTFDEAANTGALRAGWTKAISDDADYVQMVTWSDFSEGGQIVPSVQNGYVNLDLTSYYMIKWKTGAFPTILRDALYLSHRNQLLSATPQYASSSPMNQRSQSNMTTARDTVEVVSYLTAAATVSVTIAGTTSSYAAPAGEYVKTYPLANGSISTKAVRNSQTVAQLTSPIGCSANPPVQDRGYYRFSSLRPTDTYAVPTNLDGI